MSEIKIQFANALKAMTKEETAAALLVVDELIQLAEANVEAVAKHLDRAPPIIEAWMQLLKRRRDELIELHAVRKMLVQNSR